jgi:hypothetical protein
MVRGPYTHLIPTYAMRGGPRQHNTDSRASRRPAISPSPPRPAAALLRGRRADAADVDASDEEGEGEHGEGEGHEDHGGGGHACAAKARTESAERELG